MHYKDEIQRWEEYLAKNIVENKFNFGNFEIKCEKPDLQNDTNNIGIEVTCAYSELAEIRSRFGQLRIKSRDVNGEVIEYFTEEEYQKRLEKFKQDYKNHPLFKISDDGSYLIGKINSADGWNSVFEPIIIDRFKNKLGKLQKYKNFKTNGIFIITEMLLYNQLEHFYKILNMENEKYKKDNKRYYNFAILKSLSSGMILYIDFNDCSKNYEIKSN